ncbi:conjugal transfer protein TrbL family protein [Enterocloster aldenensis]|uniref:conjugal transfer protein TrbL family protein n=1 Tax=Enterocloster aldenensis TaxID=358742 RepID=UPI004026EAF7
MFIWDFVVDTVFEDIIEWFYGQLVGFLGVFFGAMGNMGAELFGLVWVQGIIQFFSYLAWALYVTGVVVAVFECAIEYQTGRGSVKDTALNAVKGFMAVGLFTVAPVELYRLAITLQVQVSSAISGRGTGIPELAAGIMDELSSVGTLKDTDLSSILGGLNPVGNGVFTIFIIIMMGYAIIKVFFANLKRGGILLTQITVGSLYMFSVPRGYVDGFVNWCKQVIGLCLTAFLQATLLTAGLLVLRSHALLGIGIMLSSGEVPRIAGQFGMDTSTKANLMGSVYAAQSAINLTRTVVTLIPK